MAVRVPPQIGAPVECSPCKWDEGSKIPPQWVLDEIAEASIHGGYTKKNGHTTCPDCHTMRSLNGTCLCT